MTSKVSAVDAAIGNAIAAEWDAAQAKKKSKKATKAKKITAKNDDNELISLAYELMGVGLNLRRLREKLIRQRQTFK